MKYIKSFLPLLFLILLSYWSIKPFFDPGFFPMHDNTQVQRVYEMHQALADGMFPVRWVSHLGYNYGYPIFNFYAPFAYYVGSFFAVLGFDALIATKLMMVLGLVLAGVFMYFLAKEFWGKGGGIIAGLLYLYTPYHAVNMYVRGAVAELWAYAFIPLAFWGMYKVFHVLLPSADSPKKIVKRTQKSLWLWISVGAIGYAGVILSHNLTAMMVTPFLFSYGVLLYIIARMKEVMQPYFILVSFLVGIMLSAFYWLPTLQEMQYTNVISVVGGKSDYRLHFVCPSQVWDSPWGFGGSTLGCVDGMSFKIGKLHILLASIGLLSLLILRKKQKTTFVLLLFFLGLLLFSGFLMLRESYFLWNLFPQMAFFQFPWRFLIMVSFLTSLFGGAIIWLLKLFITTKIPKSKLLPFFMYGAIVAFAGGIVVFNGKLFTPQMMVQATAESFTNPYHLQWVTSRISDEYMPQGFKKPRKSDEMPKEKIVLQDASGKVGMLETKTHVLQAEVDTPRKTIATVHLAYFPAWHLILDNKEIPYKIVTNGLQIEIPKGKHTLTAKFIQTPIEIIGNIISLTGVIVLLLGIIITHRKDHIHAKKTT